MDLTGADLLLEDHWLWLSMRVICTPIPGSDEEPMATDLEPVSPSPLQDPR